MGAPDRTHVERLYREGLTAVAAITEEFSSDDWARPGCGDWNTAETVRHLLAVADWYHEWLDRSERGDTSVPFPQTEFEVRNAAGVDAHRDLSGPEATSAFVERATQYLDRAGPVWGQPYGFPAGTVSVGVHAGIAATEWHLHAWDLTSGQATRHEPDDPSGLFLAAGAGVSAVRGGLSGRLIGLIMPLAATRSPWPTILERSGRA